MQIISSTPLDLSSPAFSMKPGTCFKLRHTKSKPDIPMKISAKIVKQNNRAIGPVTGGEKRIITCR